MSLRFPPSYPKSQCILRKISFWQLGYYLGVCNGILYKSLVILNTTQMIKKSFIIKSLKLTQCIQFLSFHGILLILIEKQIARAIFLINYLKVFLAFWNQIYCLQCRVSKSCFHFCFKRKTNKYFSNITSLLSLAKNKLPGKKQDKIAAIIDLNKTLSGMKLNNFVIKLYIILVLEHTNFM